MHTSSGLAGLCPDGVGAALQVRRGCRWRKMTEGEENKEIMILCHT